MARIQVSASNKASFKRRKCSALLQVYLIQNHGQSFNIQSSDIIHQTSSLVRVPRQRELYHFNIPTIGSYVLRVHTKIIVDESEELGGVETVKNFSVKVE